MLRPLAFLLVLAAPAVAWGHAEEPNSQNVFAVGGDGWVLRANVGIVQSTAPRDLICEEAFLGGEDYLLGVLGPTEWVTFGFTGVIMRTEDGCNFDLVREVARRPSDATVHPASGAIAFVMNGVMPEEGEPEQNGLWVSTDRGRTFARIQPFDPATYQTTGVRFLDANTVIVSGYDRTASGAAIAWSVDISTGAATPLDTPADITYAYVLAAAGGQVVLLGRRGDQVVFWGPIDDLDRNELVASTWPSWAKLSEDGATAWISGTEGGYGVLRGTLDVDGIATWEPLATEYTAGCVEPVGDDLYVCGLANFDAFDLLRLLPDGEVEGVLTFQQDFRGVRCDCPADSEVGTVCPLVWRELAPYFSLDPDDAPECVPDAAPDMGAPPTPDAGFDSGAPGGDDQAVAPSPGCCATARAPRTPAPWWLVGPLLVAAGARRRALTQISRRC